jgi:hypothetical protein
MCGGACEEEVGFGATEPTSKATLSLSELIAVVCVRTDLENRDLPPHFSSITLKYQTATSAILPCALLSSAPSEHSSLNLRP